MVPARSHTRTVPSSPPLTAVHGDEQAHCLGVTTFTDPPSPVRSDHLVLSTDRLRLAVAGYLARFTGTSRYHTESDLRYFLAWCAERGLDPLTARTESCTSGGCERSTGCGCRSRTARQACQHLRQSAGSDPDRLRADRAGPAGTGSRSGPAPAPPARPSTSACCSRTAAPTTPRSGIVPRCPQQRDLAGRPAPA